MSKANTRNAVKSQSLKGLVRERVTALPAEGVNFNHNQTFVSGLATKAACTIRTAITSNGVSFNHNQTILVSGAAR